MNDLRPGVVQIGKFISSTNKTFKNYVDYMDRNEAMRTVGFKKYNAIEFDGYNDYMVNPLKSNGLFTANNDSLNSVQRNQLKDIFSLAQTNGSIMWQNVFSFDNKFLEDVGLYNSQSQSLNQEQLRDSIRAGMKVFLEKEGLADSAVWSASIHLNTDNIHVHIATVEPHPTREMKTLIDPETNKTYEVRKGYVSKKTYDSFKSTVTNKLVNRDQSLERISSLIRDQLPNEGSWKELSDQKYLNMYHNIHTELPVNKRLWRYNNVSMSNVRPMIDHLTTTYLMQYKPDELNQLDAALKDEVNFRQALYGVGQNGKEFDRASDYLATKYSELYSKIGNSILREMKLDDSQNTSFANKLSEKKQSSDFKSNQHAPLNPRQGINKIKRIIGKNFEQERAVRQYDRELDKNIKQKEQDR